MVEANIDDPSAPTEEDKKTLLVVAHVVSRMLVDIGRNDCILVKLLAARLAERLGCDVSLNSEALFRLGVIIFGFHRGVKELIKDINIRE
ncbi:MAG: hypothetical protein IBX36_01395 [Dehalococcoidia bacterium]|nr:hypothetical protein [Dehalococcoidia bacterium]